jgi:hypothetical protein
MRKTTEKQQTEKRTVPANARSGARRMRLNMLIAAGAGAAKWLIVTPEKTVL